MSQSKRKMGTLFLVWLAEMIATRAPRLDRSIWWQSRRAERGEVPTVVMGGVAGYAMRGVDSTCVADVVARGRECGFHGEMQDPLSIYYYLFAFSSLWGRRRKRAIRRRIEETKRTLPPCLCTTTTTRSTLKADSQPTRPVRAIVPTCPSPAMGRQQEPCTERRLYS